MFSCCLVWSQSWRDTVLDSNPPAEKFPSSDTEEQIVHKTSCTGQFLMLHFGFCPANVLPFSRVGVGGRGTGTLTGTSYRNYSFRDQIIDQFV